MSYLITLWDNETKHRTRIASGFEDHAQQWLSHAMNCEKITRIEFAEITQQQAEFHERSKDEFEKRRAEGYVIGATLCRVCNPNRFAIK